MGNLLRIRLAGVAHRWTVSRIDPELYAELRARLRGKPSCDVLAEVHEQVRNSVRLHTLVHVHVLRASHGRPIRQDLQELERLLVAPVSSVGRRLGGCLPGAPQDPGLRCTWERAIRGLWSEP